MCFFVSVYWNFCAAMNTLPCYSFSVPLVSSIIAWVCKVTGIRDTIFDYEKVVCLSSGQNRVIPVSDEGHWPDSHCALLGRLWHRPAGVLCLFCIRSKPRINVLCDILVTCHTLKRISFHRCVFLQPFFKVIFLLFLNVSIEVFYQVYWDTTLWLLRNNSFPACEMH